MPATLARAMAATAITATRNLAIDFAICVLPLGTREGGGAAVDLMLKMLRWFPLVSPIKPSWNLESEWSLDVRRRWPHRRGRWMRNRTRRAAFLRLLRNSRSRRR